MYYLQCISVATTHYRSGVQILWNNSTQMDNRTRGLSNKTSVVSRAEGDPAVQDRTVSDYAALILVDMSPRTSYQLRGSRYEWRSWYHFFTNIIRKKVLGASSLHMSYHFQLMKWIIMYMFCNLDSSLDIYNYFVNCYTFKIYTRYVLFPIF